MTHNKKDLNTITVPDTAWESFAQDQIENEDRDIRHLLIATKVVRYLREENISKATLASKMGVSPQRVGTMLKGRSNMTTASIAKLEKATGLSLFVVPDEPAQVTVTRKTSWRGSVKAYSDFVVANVLSSTPQSPEALLSE